MCCTSLQLLRTSVQGKHVREKHPNATGSG
jgi:hypothetical protein